MRQRKDWDRVNRPWRQLLRRMFWLPALADGTPLPCSACGSLDNGHDCGNGMQMEVSWWG